MKILNYLFKQSFFVAILYTFLFASVSFSQTREILAEGTYNMGDGETPSVAESRAILQAKRIALEQAGTYVESYSKVNNLKLTEDEITVLTSGLMEVTILEKKRTIVGGGFNFWVRIKTIIQLEKMTEMATRIKGKSAIDDYKKIQEAYNKSQKEILELKRQLEQARNEKEKKQIETRITEEEILFQANEWFNKGYNYGLNKEFVMAIVAYTNAITLNPDYTVAYFYRGNAYVSNRQYNIAIENYKKAIQLDPNYAAAYNNRGDTYNSTGQYDRAIEDLTKAIELDPNDPIAYQNRGIAYYNKGQIDKASMDFQKACDMGFEYGCKALKDEEDKKIPPSAGSGL